MLVDRELRYVTANETYLRLTATRLEDLKGRRVFDLFPNDPQDPNNQPVAMLRSSFERVLATGHPDVLAWLVYRVPEQVGDQVVTRERAWSATHVPLLDENGDVAYILQHTVDVSALNDARPPGEQPSIAPIAAGVLHRAAALQEENWSLAQETHHLRELFDQAPGFMAFLEGPSHIFRHANATYFRLVGQRDILGRTVEEAIPEVIGQGFLELLDQVYTSGRPYVGQDVAVSLQRSDGPPEVAYVDFVYQPVRDQGGTVRGIFVEGSDVTERRIAQNESEAARRAAEAFSAELLEQSEKVRHALEDANRRIRELEAELAARP